MVWLTRVAISGAMHQAWDLDCWHDRLMQDIETVVPADYPELARVVWNRDPLRPISGAEALALYEANWRHVEVSALSV